MATYLPTAQMSSLPIAMFVIICNKISRSVASEFPFFDLKFVTGELYYIMLSYF